MSGAVRRTTGSRAGPARGLCHDRYDFYTLSYIDFESDAH